MFNILKRMEYLEFRCKAQGELLIELQDQLEEHRMRIQTLELTAIKKGDIATEEDVAERFRGRNGLLSYKNLHRNPVDALPEDIEVERF